MWAAYNSLPTQKNIKDVHRKGITTTVKHVFKRVGQEIKGLNEPEILQKEADYADFETKQKMLEANL